jgi:hypothetical protein
MENKSFKIVLNSLHKPCNLYDVLDNLIELGEIYLILRREVVTSSKTRPVFCTQCSVANTGSLVNYFKFKPFRFIAIVGNIRPISRGDTGHSKGIKFKCSTQKVKAGTE